MDSLSIRISLRNLFGLASLLLTFSTPAFAQWNDPVTNTPSLVQTNFGPYGTSLPGDGEAYCGPTAATMGLYWAASNGFTQLAPSYNGSLSDQASALNLELLIAGLAHSSATGGTEDSFLATGVDDYFAAKGIATTQYSTLSSSSPNLNWITGNMAANQVANPTTLTFQVFSVGWYQVDSHNPTIWNNEGGHFLTPLAVNLLTSAVTINNPYPAALENVPNVPASNPQTVGITAVPSGLSIEYLTGTDLPPSQDYSQLQTPFPSGTSYGDNSIYKAVLWGGLAWSVNVSALPGSQGYAINPWHIHAAKSINTNGADFTVLAPLEGEGGLTKLGEGAMILTASNDLHGTNSLEGGSLVSTVTSGSPFGTGTMLIENNAILETRPDDTTPAAVDLHIASGDGSQLQVDNGGGTLLLTKGNNTSLTVTIGGNRPDNSNGSTPNITATSEGSLVIAPDAGLAALGGSIKVKVVGTGANLPLVTNGIVTPNIIGQDSAANQSGAFLTYSTTDGFVAATPVLSSTTGINDGSISATTVYEANTAQQISGGQTVSVYALAISGSTLGESQAGSTLNIGDQSSGSVSGLILNGGTLATSQVQFGAAQAAVYTSAANGTIGAQINGSGGLTTFGPGSVTLTSNNASSLSGAVSINSGTLIAANTTGSATGSGVVTVQSNAALQINPGASVGGDITVETSGTLTLNGGTAGGKVKVTAVGTESSTAGGTLQGNGTIAGEATIAGMIKAGPDHGGNITFQESANLSNAEFFWQLTSLVDETTEPLGAGVDWNALTFDKMATVGSFSGGLFNVYLDFSLLAASGPESGNSFWNQQHSWTIMTFNGEYYYDYGADGNLSYQAGNFGVTWDDGTAMLVYQPAVVPEPGTWMLLLGGLTGLAMMRLGLRGGCGCKNPPRS